MKINVRTLLIGRSLSTVKPAGTPTRTILPIFVKKLNGLAQRLCCQCIRANRKLLGLAVDFQSLRHRNDEIGGMPAGRATEPLPVLLFR